MRIWPRQVKLWEVLIPDVYKRQDYAMTYEELSSMFDAKGIDPAGYVGDLQQGSKYGKEYSVSGGVTAAVIETFKEKNKDVTLKVNKCSGALECKKALMMLKVGRLPEDFVEGMACVGGCVNGPAMINKSRTFMKDRNNQISKADDRGILENVAKYENLDIDMERK